MRVLIQKWEESERGWGTRPDGYSIHQSEEDRQAYIREYMKGRDPDDVPDEYDRTDGAPYWCEIDDDDKRIEELRETSKHGIRIWNNDYPGDGGKDGWRHVKG